MLSEKQREYRRSATKTWNIKIGATRSGKTYGDYYLIPKRLLEVRGRDGLNVILGNTRGTIQRNIIDPMQTIWGAELVSSIHSDNTATLFGEKVYCLGADNIKHVDRLRGQSVKYCYGDEVVTWSKEVFAMLQSRLDKEYSKFDGACNPEGPQHWFKKKLEEAGEDWYIQHYTIDDNPYLPQKVKDRMKRDFAGTVYYARYILGEWAQAEGLIYPMHPDATERAYTPEDGWDEVALGIDYGTQNAFAALLFGRDGESWHLFTEYRYSGRDTGYQKTDEDYVRAVEDFVSKNLPESKRQGLTVYVDPSAASFIAAIMRSPLRFRVRKADNAVLDGIRDTAVCLQRGTLKIFDTCRETLKEIEGYVWDDKAEDKPVKVDDHMMDAMRYFVRTKQLAKPKRQYTSIFGG